MGTQIFYGLSNDIVLTAFYGHRWKKFIYQENDKEFSHSPVLHAIGTTSFTFAEAWRGYVDPLCTVVEPAFLARALTAYSKWCADKGIVCELLRLDPIGALAPCLATLPDQQVIEGQPVAVLRLPVDFSQYISRLPAPTQRNVRAARNRYVVSLLRPDDHVLIDEVANVHAVSLQRSGAALKWFVPAARLQTLATLPFFNIIGVRCQRSGDVVSFAGICLHGESAQVLLVGNRDLEHHPGASDLLYASIVEHMMARRAEGISLSWISFGGGRSLELSDSLIRFKLKFSLGHWKRCSYLVARHDPQEIARLEKLAIRPATTANEPIASLHGRLFPFLVGLKPSDQSS